MLIHRTAWRDLHAAEDLWTTALSRAPRLLFGVVEMTSPTLGSYVVSTATAAEGYSAMLRALTSSVAREDGMTRLDYLGIRMKPRRWGPQAGMRRRGAQSVKAVQRTHGIKDDTMVQLLDRICAGFLARVVTSDEV